MPEVGEARRISSRASQEVVLAEIFQVIDQVFDDEVTGTGCGVPAHIDNDANAFAAGELFFGEGRGHRNLVGMTLGTGLGTGVIVDGRLYRGANGGAGEIGLIPYREHTIEQS